MRQALNLVRTLTALVLCTSASVLAAPRSPVENTATLTYRIGSSDQSLRSNSVFLEPQPLPTPARVSFSRIAPGVSTAVQTPIDGGLCFSSTGSMSPLALNFQTSQSFTGANAPILETGSYRSGEPVVISLRDGNRNRDSQTRETIDLEITTSNGDREKLRLYETGNDTAIFTAVIPSRATPPAAVAHDCVLSVSQGVVLQARYVDSFFPTDIAEANVLVDPFGIVFNSSNGDPINGVRVTIVDAQTGQPATVYGDDQVSIYPSTVISGAPVTDSGGNRYTFDAGAYRFPYLAPGQYRFEITPPADFVAPSSADRTILASLRDANGNRFTITTGSFADPFILNGPEPIKIDIPVDPVPGALVLQKQASVTIASAGDFIQYQLVLQNRNRTSAARNILITDILPAGMRYVAGTLRMDAQQAANPAIARDGRTMSIPVASLGANASVTLSYVTQVISGIRVDEAVNRAVARAGLSEASNEARATVRIERPFFSDRFTIVGRVVEDQGQCRTPAKSLTGVSNIRVLLQDGTYVSTDSDGLFHFSGVKPGTHVVQLDLASLPKDLEPVACIQNTRFAGRPWSQFVDARGGSLWRTDFYLRRKAVAADKISIQLKRDTLKAGSVTYKLLLENRTQQPIHNVRLYVQLPDGAKPAALTSEQSFEYGIATLPAGAIAAHEMRTLSFVSEESDVICKEAPVTAKAFALFDRGTRKSVRTPTVEITLPCNGTNPALHSSIGNVDMPEDRVGETVKEQKLLSDQEAAGATTDWFAGQTAGTDILFPTADHNPRAPVIRVVIKHRPDHKISLKINNADVDPISFDGTDNDAASGVSISKWRGLPLQDGPNSITAELIDASGEKTTLSRTVHYANQPAYAEIVRDQSRLVADGLTQPVIAVRFTDRFGKPVRIGVTGGFELEGPYLAAQSVDDKTRRQLEGRSGEAHIFKIESDDGIAKIALEPTTQSGTAIINLELGDERARTRVKLRAWLESQVRDWVVVGFAKGTIGYNKLKGKMENLPDKKNADADYADGQVSLYAKGRVKGKWLLTVAYDSDKKRGKTASERELLRVIDPNRYYTLYGDQTQQGYDAASLERIYLKLERNQFYALFGDFETGLNQTILSRYNRSFNGLKTEYRSEHLNINAFAARTLFNYARDELQGTGLSSFYRLSKPNIILNSDKVKLETRDRFRSERILDTKTLTRHIDYDIDYDAGTLTFRQPVRSRDSDFNPIFIVVDYEVLGAAGHDTHAGGRIGAEWKNGQIQAGASLIHDEGLNSKTNLGGLDVKARISPNTEIRGEAARTHRQDFSGVDQNGNAWLAEVEHRSQQFDGLAYYRRQDGDFGVGQQNGAEAGTEKFGADGRVRISEKLQLAGSAYRENYLNTGANRTAALSRLEYITENRTLFAGFQFANDNIPGQSKLTSRLATLGGSQYLLDRKLEVQAQSDISLGGGSDSLDFPSRYRVGATYRLSDDVQFLVNHEITDGRQFDTSTTRLGMDVVPWQGGRITSTLNQAAISEYGPRTYGQFGLAQKLLLGKHWSVDAGFDSNQTFNKRATPVALNPLQPLASGGSLGEGALIDDFWSVSTGASYHNEILSWNLRAELRDGQQSNRYAITSNLLRQTSKGVAVSAFGQFLRMTRSSGQKGTLASIGAGLAYRPLGSHWSVLDKLEFKSDTLRNGTGRGGLLGFNSAQGLGDIKNQRIINNLAINRVSQPWSAEDVDGNSVDLNQRSQLSLYYGSKYSFSTFNEKYVSGYTHMLGIELRHDISPVFDIGLQASALHSFKTETLEYSFGPQAGFSPFTNGWLTFGYNIKGFRDDDFSEGNYTQKGPYIMLRLKFDQQSLRSRTQN